MKSTCPRFPDGEWQGQDLKTGLGSRVKFFWPLSFHRRCSLFKLLLPASAMTTSWWTLNRRMEQEISTIKIIKDNSFPCYCPETLFPLCCIAFPTTAILIESSLHSQSTQAFSWAFIIIYYYSFICTTSAYCLVGFQLQEDKWGPLVASPALGSE